MRIGKIKSKNLSKLLKFNLGILIVFISVGAGSCQTDDERYDAQLKQCVEQGHKDIKDGVICLENLLKSNPKEGFVYLFLARSYRDLGRLDEAEEAINIFIYAYSKYASGYSVKCEILRDKKDFNGAFLACDRAMSLEPDNSDHKRTIATLWEAQGDIERAEFWYYLALKTNPEDQPALVALGRLYETNGKLDKAIETYEKLLKLDFEFKDKLQEGIKKLKETRELELNQEKETNAPKQKKSKTKAAGKQ
jgi:tetratricopeptide (TPR) repeat protein